MDQRAIEKSFFDYFQIVPIYTEALRDIAYRIRYQVYCEELGFEDSNNFPDGRETDRFDRHSEHCLLLHKGSNNYVGCVRLVLPDPEAPARPLPFEIVCGTGLDSSVVELAKKHRGGYGEISRLALQPGFWPPRNWAPSDGVPGGINMRPQKGRGESPQLGSSYRRHHINIRRDHSSAGRREFQHMSLGLYLAGAALLVNNGLHSVFAMMEPRLARRVRRLGIHFRQVGDLVEHRGLRGPFQITRDGLFSELCPGIRNLLDVLVADLQMSNPFSRAAS